MCVNDYAGDLWLKYAYYEDLEDNNLYNMSRLIKEVKTLGDVRVIITLEKKCNNFLNRHRADIKV